MTAENVNFLLTDSYHKHSSTLSKADTGMAENGTLNPRFFCFFLNTYKLRLILECVAFNFVVDIIAVFISST